MSHESGPHFQVDKDRDSDSDNDFVMALESMEVSGHEPLPIMTTVPPEPKPVVLAASGIVEESDNNVSNAASNSSGASDAKSMNLNKLETEKDPLKHEEKPSTSEINRAGVHFAAVVSSQEQEIGNLQKMGEDMDKVKIAVYKSKLEGAMAENEPHQSSNEKLLAENESLKAKLQLLQSSQSSSATKIVAEQRLEIQDLENQVKDGSLNLVQVQGDLDAVTLTLAKVLGQLYAAQDENTILKVNNEKLSAQRMQYLNDEKKATAEREQSKADLQKWIDNAEVQRYIIKNQEEVITDLKSQLISLVSVVPVDEKVQAEMEKLKVQFLTLKEEHGRSENKIQLLQQEKELQTELVTYLEKDLCYFKKKSEKKKQRCQELTKDYQAKKNRTRELKKQVAESASAAEKLTEEIQDLQSQIRSKNEEISNLKEQLEDHIMVLNEMHTAESQKLIELREALKSAKRELQERTDEIPKLRLQVKDRNVKIDKLERQNRKIQLDLLSKQDALEESDNNFSELKKQCALELSSVDQALKTLRDEFEAKERLVEIILEEQGKLEKKYSKCNQQLINVKFKTPRDRQCNECKKMIQDLKDELKKGSTDNRLLPDTGLQKS